MSAPTLTPGTRCECVGEDHRQQIPYKAGVPQCTRDAVRMVNIGKVPIRAPGNVLTSEGAPFAVPMCAPCAEYAEAKVTRCDDPGAHRPGCKCDGGEPLL